MFTTTAGTTTTTTTTINNTVAIFDIATVRQLTNRNITIPTKKSQTVSIA